MEDTIMNSVVPAAISKLEPEYNVKNEPQLDVEEPEEGATCFDVLDEVEEPLDETTANYYSSDDNEVDKMFSNCDSSSDCGSNSQQIRTTARDNCAAGSSQSAAVDDDIEMEEVFETIDGNKDDYEECYVAERPPSPPDNPLPRGWKQVYHESGATIFVHLETNVCSLSRPYFLGTDSTKLHTLSTSPVPCLSYRSHRPGNLNNVVGYAGAYGAASADASAVICAANGAVDENASTQSAGFCTVNSSSCPFSTDTVASTTGGYIPVASKVSSLEKDVTTSISPMKSITASISVPPNKDTITPSCPKDNTTVSNFNSAVVDTDPKAGEVRLLDYCKQLFKFKTIKYMKFRSWDVRRTYLRALRNERNRRRCPFSNNKFVSFPIETKDDDGNVVSTKKWIINPRGRSYVAILHEYLQQSKKTQPEYKFTEVDNARNPYAATVVVNGTEYGTGFGMSKKEAKFEAAKATLEVLLPKMMKYVLSVCCEKPGNKKFEDCSDNDDDLQNVASAFDDIEITDPRVTELSLQTTEPKPYELLLNCLHKKGEQSEVKFDFQAESTESTMSVGEHKVTIKCANKREGKQLAAQALLQLLHPHVKNWGSLLRLYGNYTTNQYRQVSDDRDVDELKSRPANQALLNTLQQRMKKLSEKDEQDAQISSEQC